MKKYIRDFISEETRHYEFKIGKILASSLSGFVAGIIFASILWAIALFIIYL